MNASSSSLTISDDSRGDKLEAKEEALAASRAGDVPVYDPKALSKRFSSQPFKVISFDSWSCTAISQIDLFNLFPIVFEGGFSYQSHSDNFRVSGCSISNRHSFQESR